MRRFAWAWLVGVAVAASGTGCTCGSRGAGADAGPGAMGTAALGAVVDAGGASAGPAAIFSAPIAGAQIGGGEAIAVGLVVASKAIVAARVDAEGRAAWTRVVVPGAAWSPDSELHAWPIRSGAVVTWRGLRDGKMTHVRVAIAPDGSVVEGLGELGPLVCATDEGLAWTDAADGGAARVHLRTWGPSGAPARDEMGAPIADDLTLACGARRAYAVAEGDETTPTRVAAVGGDAQAALLTLAPGALGHDDQRDLFPWATGDDFGLVRLSNSGVLTAVEARSGAAVPLAAERARIPAEDDVVAVDADARAVTLITTHDESDACPDGRGGSSVHAVRMARRGPAQPVRELAKSACGADVGPFWTEPLGDALVVGWVERPSRKDKTTAPIAGVSYRVLDDGTKAGRIAQPSDAVSDAGCDRGRCYVVALARASGADGMSPEAIRVLAYP